MPSVAGKTLISVLGLDAGRLVEVGLRETAEDVTDGAADDDVVAVAFSCLLNKEK